MILTRRVSAQGRSASHANGLPVAVATLKALGERLIDIHGQHESRALLDPDRQRDLLDDLRRRRAHLVEVLSGRPERPMRPLLDRRNGPAPGFANARERERALLAFERDELAAAEPRPGEADDLAREAHRLGNAEAVRSAALEGFALLYESDRSAQGLLEKVARKLAPLVDAVPEFADASADLGRLADEAREIAYALRRFGQGWERRPRPARRGRGPPLPLPPARLPVPLRARRAGALAARGDRGEARRDRGGRRRPAGP